MEGIEGSFRPDVIVMRKHDSLGHSRSTACIDQGTALARFDFTHPLLHEFQVDSLPFSDELFVLYDLIWEFILFKFRVVIDDNDVDTTISQEVVVLLRLLSIFGKDEFGVGMGRNIFACCHVVGCVHADGQATAEETPIKGEAPFWRVEADDVD